MALLVAIALVPLQVGVHLGFQSEREHPLRTCPTDLVQGESELLASPVLRGYPQHRRTSSRRRVLAGNSDQGSTGGYATPITRSRIHNFCSYLRGDAGVRVGAWQR
jgi:hypothetical protein